MPILRIALFGIEDRIKEVSLAVLPIEPLPERTKSEEMDLK